MKSSSPKIIIIGGVAAGPAAAAKAKRINPRAEVVLFEQGEHISYGSCAMPYFIGDVIPEAEKLIHFTPASFEKEKGCPVRIFHRAEAIWPHRRRVVMRNLQTDQIAEYTYDALILATGARARVPDPAWFRYDNVFAVRSLSDSMRIKNYLASRRPSTAVIIGGGFIGMEMAEALRRHAMHVTVLHKSEWPMDSLELSGRRVVADELKRQGVKFEGNITSPEVVAEGQTVRAVISGNARFDADVVIIATGFEPNTDLAREAKIRCGASGGIIVDHHLKTNADRIWAAGACTEFKNALINKPMYLPLANIANKMGWIAGENAAGGFAEFPPVVRNTAVKIFDLEVASVGLDAASASAHGLSVIEETIMAHSRVRAYPGAKPVMITLLADKHSKRLIGANLIAEEGAALRANVLALAIQQKMTLRQIADMQMMYTPPFAPVWDPILVAANKMMKGL